MVRHDMPDVLCAHRWQWGLSSHGPCQVPVMTETSFNDPYAIGARQDYIVFGLQRMTNFHGVPRLCQCAFCTSLAVDVEQPWSVAGVNYDCDFTQ